MASLKKRGETYYAQYYVGAKQVRRCLHTSSIQIAKEKLRQLESALYRGEEGLLPTRTALPEILEDYIGHMRLAKTAASVRSDISFLRQVFGPVCPGLTPLRASGRRARAAARIDASYLEEITSADVSRCIRNHVDTRGLAPKTANRFREVLSRLFTWAISERGVHMPNGQNPVSSVVSYRVPAPVIEFLTIDDIHKQLEALAPFPKLQPMVATMIYTGIRRGELLWLTADDIDLTAGKYGMIRVQAKTIDGNFWQPKTKTNRVVPISRSLRPHIENLVTVKKACPWFFPSPKGCRWDCDNFSWSLREANKQSSLRWNCLHYRHTFGSQLAMNGISLYKIAQLMGNSPEICRRHYAALLPDSLTEAVEFDLPSPHKNAPTRLRLVSNSS